MEGGVYVKQILFNKEGHLTEQTVKLLKLGSLKDEELDVIRELISNMYGALEVQKLVKEGATQKEALNTFMQRVLGSIDK